MIHPILKIHCDLDALDAALQSLSELAEHRTEVVQRFLDGIDSFSELVRIDAESLPALGAGQLRIALQPSDRLVEFLAAVRAGKFDGS